MPHLTLEHSRNLPAAVDVYAVLRRLHEAVCASGLFRPADVKSRAVAHGAFHVGETPDAAFVHVEVAILSGRDAEVRKALGERLLAVLREELAVPLADVPRALTVEVREMDRDTYAKDSTVPA